MNTNKLVPSSFPKSLIIFFAVGLLLVIGLLATTLISCEKDSFPKPPTIITVSSLPYTVRSQIDKDILFDKAFKRFGECMNDANKTTAEDCKKEFWSSANN